ncbi:uncharacterized protein LOC109727636 [Ananas comosus]|uniref:Uncharacterized protein LOC109727636 n=1 Tax=Ananas comosus TaxID=4615 RepID=A0A6P5HCI4_ANACO|nr:uncharacterized protein LOC109727636 [Ananas comosus]
MVLEDKNAASVGRPWSNLATHILELISSQLSPSDRSHFALTCKQWNSVVGPTFPADICPLLLNCPRWGSNVIRYYSPYFNKNFELDCPFDLSGATLCSSSNRWLTLGWENKIMLADPFTGISHEVPLEEVFLFSQYGFFWDPITSKLQIFGISNGGYENVDIGIFDGERSGGELGVYNLKEDTWTVLMTKPNKFSYEECYLVESEGELFSVLIGKYGLPLHVLRLDEREMMWEKVERLEGRSLFLGSLTSVSSNSTTLESMENKVFFPRFHGDVEVIRAKVKYSSGRSFFVPKMNGENKRKDESNICWYSLADDKFHLKYFVSKKYVNSIWIDSIVASD